MGAPAHCFSHGSVRKHLENVPFLAGGNTAAAPRARASPTMNAPALPGPLAPEHDPWPSCAQSKESLCARYAPRVTRLLRHALGRDSEHEDLLHEILIVVFTRVDTVRDPGCMDSWVNQVALTTIHSTLRRRYTRPFAAPDAELDLPARPVDGDASLVAAHALDAIGRLREADRQLLERRWFRPGTIAALASQYGCSAMTLRRRLRRAEARFVRLAARDPLLRARLESSKLVRTTARTPAKLERAGNRAGRAPLR